MGNLNGYWMGMALIAAGCGIAAKCGWLTVPGATLVMSAIIVLLVIAAFGKISS